MDWKLIFQIASLVTLVLNSAVSFYVLFKNPKEHLNSQFSLFAFCFAIWSLSDFIEISAKVPAGVAVAVYLGVLGWSFAPPAFLHFALILTRKTEILRRKLTYFWLYFPPLIFIYLVWFTELIVTRQVQQLYFGYWEVEGPLFILSSLYSISLFSVSVFICWKFYHKITEISLRKQIRNLTLFVFWSLIIGAFTSGILPSFKINFFAPATMFMTPFIVFIGYSILKYGFLDITPQLAVDTIVSTIPDFLIVLDEDLNINLTNSKVSDILGYSKEELANQPFGNIFSSPEKEEIIKTLKKISLENREIDLINKNQEKIPAIINSSLLKDGNQVFGVVIIIRDNRLTKDYISQLETAKNSLEEHNKELVDLNQKLEQKYQEIESMNRLMVGRELAMAELKKKNDELKKLLGEL